MSVDMSTLKELRALTHAPLKDCKDALEQSGGDLEQAQQILREKGAAKAAKNADRATNEGIVWIKQDGGKVAGLKLACETDFVAKNDTFRGLADQIVDLLIAKSGDIDSIEQLDPALKEELELVLKDNFVTIGENMQILDVFVASKQGYIYRHPGDKVAAVVYFDGSEDAAKNVALQVAAMNPQYLSRDDVAADQVAELKAGFEAELADSGKPADIVEKIIEGKLNKEFSEIVLLEQPSIVDDSQKVKQIIGETTISGYVRYAI